MLVKLTTGERAVNFSNIQQAPLMHAVPESAKKTVKLSVFLALLGSAHAKAAHKLLMKLA